MEINLENINKELILELAKDDNVKAILEHNNVIQSLTIEQKINILKADIELDKHRQFYYKDYILNRLDDLLK